MKNLERIIVTAVIALIAFAAGFEEGARAAYGHQRAALVTVSKER